MAFTGSYVCTVFYTGLLNADYDFSADTFRMALYDSTASLTAATTAYTATGELAAAGGYTPGGEVMTMAVSTAATANGTVVIVDFTDVSWAAATFTARGALVYDDTAAGNPAVAVIDFGGDKTVTAGTFTVQAPSPTANAAWIVIGTVLGS